MSINAKKLKSILTLSDYETIEKSLGLKEFSHNDHQVIFYNADKYKDTTKQTPKLYRYNDTKNYISYTKSCSYDIIGLVQAIKTTNGEKLQYLKPEMQPKAEFAIMQNEKVLAVYAYCNLHGLWKAE